MTFDDLKKMYRQDAAKTSEDIIAAYDTFDVYATDECNGNDTLMHIAASMADDAAIRHLINKGLKATTPNDYGYSPLHALAKAEYLHQYRTFNPATRDYSLSAEDFHIRACADLLFDAGASTIRRDEEGYTPILEAARKGRFEIIESAIAHGAKITLTDNNGSTPMHIVVKNAGHIFDSMKYGTDPHAARSYESFKRCVRTLVDAGEDTEAKDDMQKTPLDLAISAGIKDIAAIITGNESAKVTGGMNVFEAIENADTKAIEILIKAGADPRQKNADGHNCLTRLLFAGECSGVPSNRRNGKTLCRNMLTMLCNAGFDINDTLDDKSNTPIIAAVCGTQHPEDFGFEFTQQLINRNCNVNAVNLNGVSAVMFACQKNINGMSGLLLSLLEAGADTNIVDKNGNTALHYAVSNGVFSKGKEVAEMLYDFGFNATDAVNGAGKTALDIAVEINNELMVKFILTKQ